MQRSNRMLIVVTNVREYQKVGYRTGLWLGELTHFYDVAEKAGFALDIASPQGGFVPLDPESLQSPVLKLGHTDQRYADRAFMNLLDDTLPIAQARAEEYDAIYLTGGHGVMFDFPASQPLADLIAQFDRQEKIVSAVCHGPAGLLEARGANGEPLLRGKKVTGFSWQEEAAAHRQGAVPFNLEAELERRGAEYSKALVPMMPHVVVDGRLITGQNPTSAQGVAEAVLGALHVG